MLQRRYLTSHVETECPCRKVDCQYCHITGEYQFIEGEHKEQCPKLPLPCPNKCKVESVPREDMESHRKECPLEMVQCEYHNVGCEERMMRKDLEIHKKEKMEKHLSLTTLQLTTALKRIDTIAIALQPIVPQAYNCHKDMHSTASIITAAQRSLNLTTMAAMIKSGNQICPVIVNITELSKKKRDQVADCYSDPFYSHDKGYKMCVRTDANGHSDGKGIHLSVFLFLMKGPHDDELTWPLRGKFKVKLLNQISDREHYLKTVGYHRDQVPDEYAGRVIDGVKAKNGWGYPQFISNEDLHKVTPTCQYLKDDCIFLQVSKL